MKRSICLFSVFCLLLLAFSCKTDLLANSVRTEWQGGSGSGELSHLEDCPLEVEKEELTFQIQDLPKQFYGKPGKAFLSLSSSVQAAYTFKNPSDETIYAKLAFPLGLYPEYGFKNRNEKTGKWEIADDLSKGSVYVNGQSIEWNPRFTLSALSSASLPDKSPADDISDLSKQAALLKQEYISDAFFNPDLPVAKLEYKISLPGKQEETSLQGRSVSLFFQPSIRQTRYLIDDYVGYVINEDGSASLDVFVEDQSNFILYILGEYTGNPPEWTGVINLQKGQAEEKKLDETQESKPIVTLISEKSMTLLDLTKNLCRTEIPASEQDWYNIVVQTLGANSSDLQVLMPWAEQADSVFDNVMRWMEYEIELGPKETQINTVTAPFYPALDTGFDPPVYTYDYLLSPAEVWKEFGDLKIEIETPFYLLKSDPAGFEKTENGYALHLDNLPEQDLSFELCSEQHPADLQQNKHGMPLAAAALGLVLFAAGLLFLMGKRQ